MTFMLKKEQITTLSLLVNVEEDILLHLSKKDVLNHNGARAILIKSEYDEMVREGTLKANIVLTLMKKYKLSKSSIEKIIYRKL